MLVVELLDDQRRERGAGVSGVPREQDGPLVLRTADGRALPLPVARWCAPPDAADEELLRHCRGPVLDVGCGPGRLTVALTERGVPALGVDISRAAVARVRACGAPALRRSVFDPLPGQGRWATIVLADGNIGTGAVPSTFPRQTRLNCWLAADAELAARNASEATEQAMRNMETPP